MYLLTEYSLWEASPIQRAYMASYVLNLGSRPFLLQQMRGDRPACRKAALRLLTKGIVDADRILTRGKCLTNPD